MSRLLYEKSVSYGGHLIVPFFFGTIEEQSIYSYKLLSELGWKGKFHKVENPAQIHSNTLEETIAIAREHLDGTSDVVSTVDLFKDRYTYQNNLFILYEESGKCFYDHYPPENLNNIAAPKLFASKPECLTWIAQQLARRQPQFS